MKRIFLIIVGILILIQLVPYGRGHVNPDHRQEPEWNSPQTRELVRRACFDCHSNETQWPWYSWVAPVSWLVEHDVAEAREHLNFSEWDREQKDADDAAEMVEEREMPLWYYLPAHPEARLSDAERAALLDGLSATIGDEHGRGRGSDSD